MNAFAQAVKTEGNVLKPALLRKIGKRLVSQQGCTLLKNAIFAPLMTAQPTLNQFHTASAISCLSRRIPPHEITSSLRHPPAVAGGLLSAAKALNDRPNFILIIE